MARSFLRFLQQQTLLHHKHQNWKFLKSDHLHRFRFKEPHACRGVHLRLSLIQSFSLSPGSSIQLARLSVSMDPSIA